MHELNARVAHLLETCKVTVIFFASEELWRKHTRGCVETIVYCAGAKLDQFANLGQSSPTRICLSNLS
jgi:hypothetical protein